MNINVSSSYFCPSKLLLNISKNHTMVTRHFFHWPCTSLAQKARFFGPAAPALIQDPSVPNALYRHVLTQIELAHQELAKQAKTPEKAEDPSQKKHRRNMHRQEKKKAKKAAKRAARKARKSALKVSKIFSYLFENNL
jgi:hypothetical protein